MAAQITWRRILVMSTLVALIAIGIAFYTHEQVVPFFHQAVAWVKSSLQGSASSDLLQRNLEACRQQVTVWEKKAAEMQSLLLSCRAAA